MNIDRLNQNLASGAYAKRAGRSGDASSAGGSSSTGGAAGAGAKADGVSLSDQARAVSRAQAAPDVREQLVAELREQIQNGTYQIDDEAIVNRILEGNA